VQAPVFSDDALALEFADRHAEDLRFVATWNKWLFWDCGHWRFEETLRAWDFAREVCRAAADDCGKIKAGTAPSIASAKTVAAVERMARSDRRIAATIDQWDNDPWLLNTPDGVIDLRTGKARSHRAEDYITKITTVGPHGDCPRFLAFLDRITCGDNELVCYLQRLLGYGLTGLTREHALFFGYGTGANGKSVLLSTVAGILGDYHRSAPIETFAATNGDRHPTDLAGLRGARLVTATETEEGRRWAESRIKQLTGGDTVSARFMRQDFFEYADSPSRRRCPQRDHDNSADDGGRHAGRDGVSRRVGWTHGLFADAASIVDPALAAADLAGTKASSTQLDSETLLIESPGASLGPAFGYAPGVGLFADISSNHSVSPRNKGEKRSVGGARSNASGASNQRSCPNEMLLDSRTLCDHHFGPRRRNASSCSRRRARRAERQRSCND